MSVFLFIIFALISSAAQAEEFVLGTIEVVEKDIATVTQASDRPRVIPEELVKIRSRIPGLDEIIESGKGYVYATTKDSFQIKITEGEPILGEEVVLLMGEFLNQTPPTDEETWRRMGYEDLRRGANKPPNVAALCVLGKMHTEGKEIEKNDYSAYVLFQYASRFNPSADCAYEYGSRLRDGDLENNPPKYSYDYEKAETWLHYAAERGHYLAMRSYADMLEIRRQYREAERWLKKAVEIEPEFIKSIDPVENQLRRVRRKMR